ncbi:MAG: DUF2786 domain-containing protein [Rhodobacterales bacterium]|nr:DUF2786 domain-containing protein [Rhodobacterales bacterium]
MERQLLRQLHHEWAVANSYYLKGALRSPVIALSKGTSRLGSWNAATRTLSLFRVLVLEHPWPQVNEVLRHEMAHQFVTDVLRPVGETAHGEAFRQAAERLGVDAVAAGLVEVTSSEASVHRKIRKLLSLATSNNQHEAEAAAARAQRLMLKHNLDQVLQSTYTARVMGPTKKRFQRWEKAVMGLLAAHYFVDVMWVPLYDRDRDLRGNAAECMGTPSNLDLAEYVYGFLCTTAERLWREWSVKRRGKQRSDRQNFMCGVISGFDAQLRRQRVQNEQTGLGWVEDPGLVSHVERRYPRVVRRASKGTRLTGAYAAGNVAGQGITLSRGIQTGERRGRLLGPG